jgi:hypothetical protein
MFHVYNLRPFSTVYLRHVVPVSTPKDDDDEFEVSHIYDVCIKSFQGRRGKYLLFMTYCNEDDIPPILHRLNEVDRAMTLQYFMETHQWQVF